MNDDIMSTTNKLLFKADGMGFVGRTVSNEGILDTIKSLVGTFSTQLTSIKNVFVSNKNRTLDLPLKQSDLNVYARELVKLRPYVQDIIQTFEYRDIMEYKIPTVAKLDTNFLNTANEINNVYKNLDKKLDHYLNNLDTLISNVLGDVGFRTSSRPVKPDYEAKEYSDELRKKLATILNGKKMDDLDKVKYIYPNMRSMLDTFDILVSISSATTINSLYKLKDYCADIESKITILLSDIKEKQIEVSRPILVKLSEDLENCANIITLVVSYTELYNRLVLCVKKHVEIIPTFEEYIKK